MLDMNALRKINEEIKETYDDYLANLEETREKIEIAKNAIESTIEDNKRRPAAVFKQSLHFLSDKYTKQGLPNTFFKC